MRTGIDRASASDRAFLAMDTGPVPEQFGVLLMFDHGQAPDLATARRLVRQRIAAIPRLRRRLAATPVGCGGPVWVDDPRFDLRNHVREIPCPDHEDEQTVVYTALEAVLAPLPRSRPLWAVLVVTGPDGSTAGLVVVLHHALADGVAGLALLAGLVDQGARHVDVPFPQPRPSPAALAVDALTGRARAALHAGRSWRLLRESMAGGGGLHPPRAQDCSLFQRTGPRRRISLVRTDLDRLRTAAHALGATTNDAVLVAVARALHGVLRARGEQVDDFVITVPVSGRSDGDGSDNLGNMVSPLIVSVPGTGPVEPALHHVSADVRYHRSQATGPPPIALLGWLFRPLASLGGYHWYMSHQHRFHTLVSHLRGPAEPLTFGGAEIRSAVPLSVAEGGNVPVYFEVLSYAGTLTVTVIMDPDHFPEALELTARLREALEHIAGLHPVASRA